MGLAKADQQLISVPKLSKVNFIGDPGCDGLGAGIMSVFSKALSQEADLSLVVGDMVPFGSRQIYQNVVDFIDSITNSPVFTLKGNHDTDFFDEFFGSPNYAIVAPNLLIIVLDNARRAFTPEALEFTRKILKESPRENIIFSFHYPPPNPLVSNSINPPEWDLLRELYKPHIDNIRYFIAGHVHSLAESEIDGVPIIVTGGGGARIESVSPEVDAAYIRHHIVQVYIDKSGQFSHRFVFLDDEVGSPELEDEDLKNKLEDTFQNEILAHFKYRLMAQNAAEQGWSELAKLFRALSDSEFYHAANHYTVQGRNKSVQEDLENSIAGETYEVDHLYKDLVAYSESKGHSLAKYTFQDALNAEKVHKDLLSKAIEAVNEETDIPKADYWTCSSCGYTFEVDKAPQRCPVCGAPGDKIIIVN